MCMDTCMHIYMAICRGLRADICPGMGMGMWHVNGVWIGMYIGMYLGTAIIILISLLFEPRLLVSGIAHSYTCMDRHKRPPARTHAPASAHTHTRTHVFGRLVPEHSGLDLF